MQRQRADQIVFRRIEFATVEILAFERCNVAAVVFSHYCESLIL